MASRGADKTSGKNLPQSGAGQTSDLHLPDRAGVQVRRLVVHVKGPTSRSYKDADQIIFRTAFCCCSSDSVYLTIFCPNFTYYSPVEPTAQS